MLRIAILERKRIHEFYENDQFLMTETTFRPASPDIVLTSKVIRKSNMLDNVRIPSRVKTPCAFSHPSKFRLYSSCSPILTWGQESEIYFNRIATPRIFEAHRGTCNMESTSKRFRTRGISRNAAR